MRRPAFEVSVRVFLQQKRAQVEAEARITADEVAGYCTVCGYSHRPEDRRRAVRRMLPMTFEEIREAWPCYYGPGDTGKQRLRRDLLAIGANIDREGLFKGVWYLPTVPAGVEHGACP